MSKKKSKKIFKAPSHILEKYYQSLKQSISNETAKPTPSIKENQEYGSTDSVVFDDDSTMASPKKRKEMPKWLKDFCIYASILTAILWYFWHISASVNEIKSKADSINGEISVLENKMDNTYKDLTVGQNDIKVILERIIGKMDRLFDNISFLQKTKDNYPPPKSTDRSSKE